MGAINSIWCGGVVDIYSLFHIRELYLLGKEAEESFLIEMAEDISIATQQILSWSGDTMGFCAIVACSRRDLESALREWMRE